MIKMAGLCGAVTVQDILEADRALRTPEFKLIQESATFERREEAPGQVSDVGINNNKWRRPVKEFGPGDTSLKQQISTHELIGDFDVDSMDWKRSEKVINILLENVLFKEFKSQAARYYGLTLGKYVRQGSSREGLKIRKADEYDTVLLFGINGLALEPVAMDSQPGLGLLKVSRRETMEELRTRYPQLVNEGVFTFQGHGIYLNSRNLHERVFESLIDAATSEVERKIDEANVRKCSAVGFKIKRQINPPSINLTFLITTTDPDNDARTSFSTLAATLESAARNQSNVARAYQIDVDIVPGLQISLDTVPNPFNPRDSMECPVYAVFKWKNETQRSAMLFRDPEVIWRFCTSGYEKHIMDVARTKKSQAYILTACRLFKAYVKSKPIKPTQFGHLMKSYYLKNIAFYCILYVTVINGKELSGVQEALGYFLDFLDVCLIEERLPHFFYCNEWMKYMFPDYEPVEGYKVDLFESARKKGTLVNARESQWENIKRDFQALYQYDVFIYPDFKDRFREFVQSGEYCITCP